MGRSETLGANLAKKRTKAWLRHHLAQSPPTAADNASLSRWLDTLDPNAEVGSEIAARVFLPLNPNFKYQPNERP